MIQSELFGTGPAATIEGWAYEPEFLSHAEEKELLAIVEALPLEDMRYKGYVARRRGISFGGQYDFDANRLNPSTPLPPSLHPLRAKVARWVGIAPEAFTHMLVAQYRPGTPLGWHRDVPDFDLVAGVSLLGAAVMQFRPYPPPVPAGRPWRRTSGSSSSLAPSICCAARRDGDGSTACSRPSRCAIRSRCAPGEGPAKGP